MKKSIVKLFFISFLMCFSVQSLLSAQLQVVKPTEDIKSLFDKGLYQEVVEQYAAQPRSLSADNLAYVAEAYFYLDDLINASRYIDLSVQKSAKCARAYYVKGLVQNANGSADDAKVSFEKAIAISPDFADAYVGLGDVFVAKEDTDKALENYKKATSFNPPSEKAFYMIGVIYASRDDLSDALNVFYTAKDKIKKDEELLVTVLYNIARIEYDFGRYTKAAEAYEELVGYLPDDYYSYEKLVQCYVKLGEYNKAAASKTKLYNAYKEGQLASTTISDNFCIDQFKVGSFDVYAYERYEESSSQPFVKNIFYVMNDSGEVDSSIFVEYTPSLDNQSGGEYKVSKIKGVTRYTYGRAFSKGVEYTSLRSYIEDAISGKEVPVSSN
ncbi:MULTISPECIES: tetratricopeptide repeat protein [Dysgonomonas]|uniref:tetratricopeptide repeat protein n=1 Tax=Dysgonomonas TaxID=156973 RepID=UPI0009276D28|nr:MULTISPECIES: tetratricopeptide repeat protein [Dysgonomonas]MBN9302582.1 tetratricopeptide repeat protein [Dysgonomonas mossii]OJX62044.1 MAG: hypothetical protein BGO84_18020 [Dysgonomonas sp. 37-18]